VIDSALSIRSIGGGACLNVQPPVVAPGGYVYEVDVEITATDLMARAVVDMEVSPARRDVDLVEFVRDLVEHWRGWPGHRLWRSLDARMQIEAAHDGVGHVRWDVTLTGPIAAPVDESWSAHVLIVLEAGEQLSTIAADLAVIFAHAAGNPT
jgi:Family of unknown function (DUF6228)